MATTMDIDDRRTKRELRLEIGRLRRRIDRRVRSLEREGLRLVSWRTYVERYPAYAVAAAFGIGLAASAATGGGWARLLGLRLARRAVDKAAGGVWEELKGIWAESKSGRASGDRSGAEDGRS